MTVTLNLLTSETPPQGQPAIVDLPPLLVRGALNSANLTYGYTALSTASSQSWTLPPQGQDGSDIQVVLGLNRYVMNNSSPGALYAGILQFTDSFGFSEVDVPVSAVQGSTAGLWVGQASITQVANYLKTYQRDAINNLVISNNGSYVVTGIETDLGAVSQPFPLRLILHNDGANTVLLQRVYYGLDPGSNLVVATSQSALDPARLATARRISAVDLPWSSNNAPWVCTGTLEPGGTLATAVSLPYDDQASNPFLHTYNPDHDNLDASFQEELPPGAESYNIARQITLSFLPPGDDFQSLTQITNSKFMTRYNIPITPDGVAPIRGYAAISTLLLLCLAAGLAPLELRAEVPNFSPPERLTYQGYLVDANGNKLGDANPQNYDVIFRIWNDQASTDTSHLLWSEQQTITVDKGYFSVLLGEGSPYNTEPNGKLSDVFAGSDASQRYIGVTVKGIASDGSDVTIQPRLRLLTSPYAFLAQRAVNAQTLVNGTYAQVVNITGSNVGINKASPASALDVNGTVKTTGLEVTGPVTISGNNVLEFGIGASGKGTTAGKIGYQWYDNGLNISGAGADGHRVVSILAEDGTFTFGGVGVNNGTITPGYKLDVNGAARVGGDVTATGSVTATSFAGYGTVPIGGIIMWSGSSVPAGWHLCDGTTVNGVATPDLRGRFIVGTSSTYGLKTTGGSATHTLSINEIPSHSHAIDHHSFTFHGGVGDSHTIELLQTGSAASPYSTEVTGGGQAFSTIPPYYALAYIIRVQ
ncbi:MAG: tail fiber protein [Candidatus Omnitrophica bacterium]|nr:tail fiber protein [Candidatus Omnitrophota bacterium]